MAGTPCSLRRSSAPAQHHRQPPAPPPEPSSHTPQTADLERDPSIRRDPDRAAAHTAPRHHRTILMLRGRRPGLRSFELRSSSPSHDCRPPTASRTGRKNPHYPRRWGLPPPRPKPAATAVRECGRGPSGGTAGNRPSSPRGRPGAGLGSD
jgi:hypothetical protein